jgi:hypothetical protein
MLNHLDSSISVVTYHHMEHLQYSLKRKIPLFYGSGTLVPVGTSLHFIKLWMDNTSILVRSYTQSVSIEMGMIPELVGFGGDVYSPKFNAESF